MIFGIAAFKAYLVATYFMHLGLEPRYMRVLAATAVGTMVLLYVSLVP